MNKLMIASKFICFCLIGGTLILSINYFIESKIRYCASLKQDDSYDIYRELGYPEVKADGVIFGTSQALNAINPRLLTGLGLEFYNFSFRASNTEYFLYWFYPLFKKFYPKPKLIVFEVNHSTLSYGLTRTIEYDIKYFPLNIFFEVLTNPEYNMPFIEILKQKNKANDTFCLLPGSQYSEKFALHDYRGFSPLFIGGWKQDKPDGFWDMSKSNPIKPKKVALFELLINQFLEDGIKVIFVNTPEYTRARKPNTKSFEIIESFAKRKNIPFLNYDEEYRSKLNDNDYYFGNVTHLNYFGYIPFSIQFKKDLAPILEKLLPPASETIQTPNTNMTYEN